MTRNKLWRLSTASIIMFGWLFLTPAQADDPIALGATQISDLKSKVSNLVDQTKTLELVNQAQIKYNEAVSARDAKISSQQAYKDAVNSSTILLSELNFAQSAVDSQILVADSALQTKNSAQQTLDLAIIALNAQQAIVDSYQSIQPGINYDVYDCWSPFNIYNNAPPLGCNSAPIYTSASPNIDANWGGGGPSGTRGDDFQIHWYGYIKGTIHWTPQFRICSDDGGQLYLNGQLIVNDWWDRGFSCANIAAYYMSSDAYIPISVWFYENGGGAAIQLQWNIGNGWAVVPIDRFAISAQSAPQSEIDKLNQFTLEKNIAQSNYDAALATYNLENENLQMFQNNLSLKQSQYQISQQNVSLTLNTMNTCESVYNQKIIEMNDAINLAWKEYNAQFKFEEEQRVAAAIALAVQNQVQPTPETSIIVTPEPTPQQTEQATPNPSPSSEIKPEVTPAPDPTPEPSVEPSPQVTDITPSPTTQSKTNPVSNIDNSNNSPVDEQTANLIADLTNSNTLTKLTPEQRAKVAVTLGIKAEEITKVAELAKSNMAVAEALQQFGDRANANLNAPMPYTLADATTEVQAEKLLSDPISVFTNIDLTKILNPSEWGKDMTDDQREKTQEIVIPVIIASNLVASAMIRRI